MPQRSGKKGEFYLSVFSFCKIPCTPPHPGAQERMILAPSPYMGSGFLKRAIFILARPLDKLYSDATYWQKPSSYNLFLNCGKWNATKS